MVRWTRRDGSFTTICQVINLQQVKDTSYHLMRELRNIMWACTGASVASLYIAVDFYWMLPNANEVPALYVWS